MSAAEISNYLGVDPVTVYRWCRQGRLPCIKVGRNWRIRRESLEEFLRKGERSETLAGRLRSFIEVPDSVLAVSQDRDLSRRLDAAFFQVAEARGGTLIKYYRADGSGDSLAELRMSLVREGLEVDRLEEEGRLHFLVEEDPPGHRVEALKKLAADLHEAEGDGVLWANFNWEERIDLETALEQQRALYRLTRDDQVVIQTSVLEQVIDKWSGALLRRVQAVHLGMVWASEAGLSLSRAMPMPRN